MKTKKSPTTQRQIVKVHDLGNMFPEQKDKLPGPAEHLGRRKRWVGIGWVDEGEADGTEPLYIDEGPTLTEEELADVSNSRK